MGRCFMGGRKEFEMMIDTSVQTELRRLCGDLNECNLTDENFGHFISLQLDFLETLGKKNVFI